MEFSVQTSTTITQPAVHKDPSQPPSVAIHFSPVTHITAGHIGPNPHPDDRSPSLKLRCKQCCSSQRLRQIIALICTLVIGLVIGTFGGPALINAINNDSSANPPTDSMLASTGEDNLWHSSSTGIDNTLFSSSSTGKDEDDDDDDDDIDNDNDASSSTGNFFSFSSTGTME